MITFSEWLNLHEMPMKMNLVGNMGNSWDKNQQYRFDDRSHKMLNSDKAKEKIVRRMQNVPYDFNVYFIQLENEQRLITAKIHKKMMHYEYESMGITPEQAPIIDGKINMFAGSWESDPPSAWMIVHRFAHADNELTSYVYKLLIDAGKQMSRKQSDYDIVSGFGTMKSARNSDLGGAEEPCHEVITQFIMSKRIVFDSRRKMWATQEDDNVLKQLSTKLEQVIKKHLENATNFVYLIF